ncbi:MAG TPA: hypothetical protein VEI73_17455 [Candidatus Acidoferrum sp.]|nr:hypothetical protein [Candidatus Acidoferrum sp.]
MVPQLVEAYHFLRVLIPAGALWPVLRWSYKRWQKYQEDLVLSTFHLDPAEGPRQSAHGVTGELYVKAALSDARGYIPPKKLTFAYCWRALFYRTRHMMRAKLLLPDKERAEKILRNLWERNLLELAEWSRTNKVYKLRTSAG